MTHRHAAIVYKSGRVLAVGVNRYRNDPSNWIDSDGVTRHAEVAAISQVSKENLKGATVYVARQGRCDTHMLSRPCPKCYDALVAAGVKKIIYTD